MINRLCMAMLWLWLWLSPLSVVAKTPPNQWLEAQVITSKVYVQAQAVYRLRFYQSVALQHLQMTAPTARLAQIVPVGERRIFEAERAGSRYRVNEQYYSVTPLASGSLNLVDAQVTATRPGQDQIHFHWQAPPLMLTVLPVPSAAKNSHWLPAHNVEMTQLWSIAGGEQHQGQVITRQVEITAVGVNAAQIPPLAMEVSGMLVQPQPPVLENTAQGELIVGRRTQTFLLLPLEAGEFIVPSLSVPWWNTQTDTLELATLPKKLWRIKAAAVETKIAPSPEVSAILPSVEMMKQSRTSHLIAWQIVGVTTVLILVLVLVMMRTGVHHWWQVLRASHTGDAREIRDAVLAWVRTLWSESPPQTLAALASMLDDAEVRQMLAQLERELYGRQNLVFSGKSSVISIDKIRRSVLRARKDF